MEDYGLVLRVQYSKISQKLKRRLAMGYMRRNGDHHRNCINVALLSLSGCVMIQKTEIYIGIIQGLF